MRERKNRLWRLRLSYKRAVFCAVGRIAVMVVRAVVWFVRISSESSRVTAKISEVLSSNNYTYKRLY